MFLEAEKTAGIVHQHVGVEDEQFGNGGLLDGCGLARHLLGLWLGLEGCDEIQNFLGMARHLNSAPFLAQDAIAVDLGLGIDNSNWQILPGEHSADGFFYAKLQKKANG